jgi:UDP-N-acetylmuramoyl-L-alanyl-D-glutamate--2,6-diaminopimelate ligase
MRLRELLASLPSFVVPSGVSLDREVVRVSRDTRDCDEQTVLVAVRGGSFDPVPLLPGVRAAAVVVDRDAVVAEGVVKITVADARAALGPLAAALYGFPARSLTMIGITGTNGKTTTATLVAQAQTALGRKAASIGTLGTFLDGAPRPSALTTPEAHDLQRLLSELKSDGAEVVAMEASSIGLVQHRTAGVPFHTAVFTNLTQDHLDFHGTMEAYAEAKALLFREESLRSSGGFPRGLGQGDDPWWATVGAGISDRWSYGFGARNDLRIGALDAGPQGMRFPLTTPVGTTEVVSPLVGRHNAENLTAAVGVLVTCGIGLAEAAWAVGSVKGVSGRLEVVAHPELLVVVDYAHTDDALAKALDSVRASTKGRLWVVFGCGGDRDATKRPKMGRAAQGHADVVVVTSDNPRTEDPQSIVDAVLSGMDRPADHVDLDRGAAILWAVKNARAGDTVVIAGKGHEQTQEIGGIKTAFDDRLVARAALEQR